MTSRRRLRVEPKRRAAPSVQAEHRDHAASEASSADAVATALAKHFGNGPALAWWRARGAAPLSVRADARSEAQAERIGEQLQGVVRKRVRQLRAMPTPSPRMAALAQAHVAQALAQPGAALPSALQRHWSAQARADLSRVRVHHGGAAAQAAASVGARAFAYGDQLVFAAGQYAPHTARGQRLLAHELGHVIAGRGRQPVIERQDDEPELDEEGRIVIDITAPPPVWFTYMNGRFVVRVQGDYIALEVLHWSRERVEALFWEDRRPDVADPRLPAETFIHAIERETGLSFLPEARAALLARGPIPMEPFETSMYVIEIDDADLVRWLGPEQWTEYLSRPTGPGGRPARRTGEDSAADVAELPEDAAAVAMPIDAQRQALANDAQLAVLYLLILEHFTGLSQTSALDEQAADGLDARELAPILAADARRPILTDLFTQGWSEFRAAGGSDHIAFEPLIERILEQYLRGNILARANLLRIGHGIPERDELGIVQRRTRLLLYDRFGLPMQSFTGIALRDPGFIGYDPYGMPEPREGEGEEVDPDHYLTEDDISTVLLANLFSQALGVDDTAMVAQAAQAIFNNLERVAHSVEDELAEEIRRALGPTLFILAMFMLGHAAARLLMRSPNPVAVAIGLALEALLRAAGLILGLDFLGQTFEVLLRAAFHLSRVHNNAEGVPTRLSELHIESAARPLAQLITNIAIAMGIAAFGLAMRRIRAGRSRGVIENPAEGLRELEVGRPERAAEAPPEAPAPEAVPEAPPEAAPPEAPVDAAGGRGSAARSLRPGWATRMRARLLGAVMSGVVEAVPATGGTGGGLSGPLVEAAPRVATVEAPPTLPERVTVPEAAEVRAAPEARASEAAPTEAPAQAPVAEAAPAVTEAPAPATPEVVVPPAAPGVAAGASTVWVNTASGRYHRAGSRWYGATAQGQYMSEADARAAGYTEAGTPRPLPPSGAYEVTRPERGEPRVVIRAWIGERSERASLEREMMSAAEYGIAELEGYHRAHSTGAGLGAESGEAIRLAPGELVNQTMQRRGIEGFIRELADIAMSEGVRIHLTTETRTHPRGLRLASIHYSVEAATAEGRITLFDAVIEVRTNGEARAGVRLAGSDTYTFGPWFAQ